MFYDAKVSRRAMLQRSFGAAASTGVWFGCAGGTDASVRIPHLVPQAKHVIFCFMSGGVSQALPIRSTGTLTICPVSPTMVRPRCWPSDEEAPIH